MRASVGLRALDKALAGQRGRTPAGAASAETAGPTRAVVVNRVAVKAEGKAANAHVAQPVPTAAKALAQPHVSTLADGRLDVGAHLPLLAGRYRYVCTLGSGATADVVACDDTFATPGARGSTVVIKVVNRRYAANARYEVRVMRYLQTLGGTSFEPMPRMAPAPAPVCARLLNAFNFHGHVCLVVERCHGGTLLEFVAETGGLSREARASAVRKLAVQLVTALASMHRRGIAHADIKPENILLTRPLASRGGAAAGAAPSVAVRLVDFGNAFAVNAANRRATAAEHGYNICTLPYRAPEVLLESNEGYDERIDTWALGCVLAECIVQRPLFECYSPAQLLQRMTEVLEGTPPAAMLGDAGASPERPGWRWLNEAGILSAKECPARRETRLFRELMTATDAHVADAICWMLRYDPEERPSFGQLAAHGLLRGVVPGGLFLNLAADEMAAGAPEVSLRYPPPAPPLPPLPPPASRVEATEPVEDVAANALDASAEAGEERSSASAAKAKAKHSDAATTLGKAVKREKKRPPPAADAATAATAAAPARPTSYPKRARKSGASEWWKS